jgi:hypothetical protein
MSDHRLPPAQFDLFHTPAEPKPRSSIAGLSAHLDQHCRCGATLAVIVVGKGPHTAALRCPDCNVFRQRLPRKVCEFLSELVACTGRPTEPIEIYEQVRPPTEGE